MAGALLLFGSVLRAQEISLGEEHPTSARKGHVVLLSDTVVVEAGKSQMVELHFRVDDGFHINSHVPSDGLLVPTSLKLVEMQGLRLVGVEYPKGVTFQFAGQGETLDVYQGDFRVRLQVVAPGGDSTLSGALRYQACDNAGCFPPRTLPVKVFVTGK